MSRPRRPRFASGACRSAGDPRQLLEARTGGRSGGWSIAFRLGDVGDPAVDHDGGVEDQGAGPFDFL